MNSSSTNEPPQPLPMVVTVLGESEVVLTGRIEEIQPRSMRLWLDVETAPSRFKLGAPVKIEAQDSLWLGEISYLRQSSGVVEVGVDLMHVLRDLSTLARLAERFLGKVNSLSADAEREPVVRQ